jgi:hypothetical protein
MTLTWLANTTQGFMVGDYISTSFSGGKAYPVFAVATAPSGGVFNEAMFTVTVGLTALRGVNTSRGDQTFDSASAASKNARRYR